MAITYILKCNDGRYYVGSTIHLDQRLKEHSSCKGRFTKLRLPVKLIYKEEFKTYSEARKREYEIKGKKSRLYIEKLIQTKQQVAIVAVPVCTGTSIRDLPRSSSGQGS